MEHVLLKTHLCDGETVLQPEDVWAKPTPKEAYVAISHQSPPLCSRGMLPGYPCNLAAAKSLQLCPTLRDPTGSIPLGSPVPGVLQARTLEWVAISFSNA